MMVRGFMRMGRTGKLAGRRKTLLGIERLRQEEPVGVMLKHVVERAILAPGLNLHGTGGLLAGQTIDVNSLNPGYQVTGILDLGEKQAVGHFDRLLQIGQSVRVEGGHMQVYDIAHQRIRQRLDENLIDLSSAESLRDAARVFSEVLHVDGPASGGTGTSAQVTLPNAVVPMVNAQNAFRTIFTHDFYLLIG